MRSEQELREEYAYWAGYLDGLDKAGKGEGQDWDSAVGRFNTLRWVLGREDSALGVAWQKKSKMLEEFRESLKTSEQGDGEEE